MRGVRRSFSVDFHIVEFDELAYWNFRCWVFISPCMTRQVRKNTNLSYFSDDPSTTCYTTSVVYKRCSSCIYSIHNHISILPFLFRKKRKEKFFHRRRNNIITIAYWWAHNIIMPAYIIGLYVYGDDLSVLLYMIHTRRLLYRFCGNLLIFSVFFFFC